MIMWLRASSLSPTVFRCSGSIHSSGPPLAPAPSMYVSFHLCSYLRRFFGSCCTIPIPLYSFPMALSFSPFLRLSVSCIFYWLLFLFSVGPPSLNREFSPSCRALQPRKARPCNTAYGAKDPRPHARSRHSHRDHGPFSVPSHLVGPHDHAQRVGAVPARAGSTRLAHLPRSPEKAFDWCAHSAQIPWVFFSVGTGSRLLW